MNAKELMTNLEQVMDTIGVDPKFKENPAYEEVLSEIRNMILQMNIVDYEKVSVKSEEGSVSFKYDSEFGDKYSVDIYCSDPNSIIFSRNVDKKPYTATNGQDVRVGERDQSVAKYDSKIGNVTIVNSSITVDDFECERGEHNSHEMVAKINYDSNGVMDVAERSYLSTKLPIPYESASRSVSTAIENRFDERRLLRREKIDTARMVVIDNKNRNREVVFSATIPLSGEHGYKNMAVQNGMNENTESIEIGQKTEFEVQEMLNKETDPKVREGLARFAVGRAEYHYNSAEDPGFKNLVDENNMTRSI